MRFLKYFFWGGTSYCLELFLFWLFVNVLPIINIDVLLVVSNVLSIGIAVIYNFITQRNLTFKSHKPTGRQIFYYVCLLLFNKVLQSILLVIAHHLGFPPTPCKAVVMVLVIFWNYFAYREIVFK